MQIMSKNNRKYLLLCHLIFVTKYRRKLFIDNGLKTYALQYIKQMPKNLQ